MSVSLTCVQNVTLDTWYLWKRLVVRDFYACGVQWKAFNALRDTFRTSWQNMKALQGLHCSTNQKHIHTERMIKRFDWTQMSAPGFILLVLLCCQTLHHCPSNLCVNSDCGFAQTKNKSPRAHLIHTGLGKPHPSKQWFCIIC